MLFTQLLEQFDFRTVFLTTINEKRLTGPSVRLNMPYEGRSVLSVYFKNLGRQSNPFPCSECGNLVLAKHYEKHYSVLHDLDTKLNCVWCRGNVSWKRGQKSKRVDHLLKCFRNFVALNPLEGQRNTTEFNSEPMCPAKSFFGHAKIPTLPPRAYQPVWPFPLDPIMSPFDDDNLKLASSCVQKYLELKDTTEWFHVMVRAVAFPSFLQALDEDEGKTRTLPFSCWCDGGSYKEDHIRQHRHMIIVSPKGHFVNNVWKKISIPPEDRPCKNIRCIQRIGIHSTLHLVNCLGYLSQRKSRCNFSFQIERQTNGNLNHFYIFKILPVDYKVAIVLHWDGGIMELIEQDFHYLDIGKLLQAPVFFAGRRWQLKVKDLPGIKLNLALPISKHFRFVKDPTDHFLHLTGGRKLYFEHRENQALDAMLPLFYNEVGEETWTPRDCHQKILNIVKPTIERNTELVAENAALKKKYEDEVDEVKELNKTIRLLHEGEIARLKEEMGSIRRLYEDKIARLHEEVRSIRRQYEGEIARLNEEMSSLKKVQIIVFPQYPSESNI